MKSPKTLQERFNATQNGTGAKDVFLKEAKQLYSSLIPNAATFDQTVKILKNKSVLNENYVDLKPVNEYEGRTQEPWEMKFKSFLKEVAEEAVKADSTKVSKYAESAKKKGYDNSDVKNLDNQIGQEVLNGIAFEARENPTKTLDEIRAIVSKNLAKDRLYYAKNAMFGIKGVGYSDEIPGMKASKTDQMTPVKMKSVNESMYTKGDQKVTSIISKFDPNYQKDNGVRISVDTLKEKYLGKTVKTPEGDEYKVIDVLKNENGIMVLITRGIEDGRKENLLPRHVTIVNSINESKVSKLDQRLKDIHKAGDLVTLEAKMEAIDEEINAKNERINMIGENEDLAELVNPVKLREMKKEIKNLEREKAKYQKIYEKMTGNKKAEVIDEPQEVDTEVEDDSVNDESLNENSEEWPVSEDFAKAEELADQVSLWYQKNKPEQEDRIETQLENLLARLQGPEMDLEYPDFKRIIWARYKEALQHPEHTTREINESSVFQFRLKK